jgi:hypothetical protein
MQQNTHTQDTNVCTNYIKLLYLHIICLHVFTFTVLATHRYFTSLWFICYRYVYVRLCFMGMNHPSGNIRAWFVHILTEHEKQQSVNGPSPTKGNFIRHAAPWFCLRTRVRRRTSNGRGWYTLGILLCGWNLSFLLHFVLTCAFYRIEIRVSTFSGALQLHPRQEMKQYNVQGTESEPTCPHWGLG